MKSTEKTSKDEAPAPVPVSRPFLLTLLCIFSFIFFGLISLLLLISVFYTGSLRDLLNTYIVGDPVSTLGVFSVLMLLFVLYASAFAGTALMWRMKKTGYYLFGIPVLAISAYQLFQHKIPTLSTFILISLLLLFGAFFKRLK
jgi:hypothetical protein